MRKPAFCICENKDADQLRANREADQRLCFRYMDSIIPLFLKGIGLQRIFLISEESGSRDKHFAANFMKIGGSVS